MKIMNEKAHIYINNKTLFNMRLIGARLGCIKRLSHDKAVQVLLLSFSKFTDIDALRNSAEFKKIIEA